MYTFYDSDLWCEAAFQTLNGGKQYFSKTTSFSFPLLTGTKGICFGETRPKVLPAFPAQLSFCKVWIELLC
jgi:hypothetical protein